MARQSKKQVQAYRMELTAWFGLAIFAIGLIAQLLAVVTSYTAFTKQPYVTFGQIAPIVAGWLVTLLAGIIPPLVAYLVGEKLAKPRARYEHYYNGVLFAFLAIWLSAAISSVLFSFVPVPTNLIIPFEYIQYIPQLVSLAIVVLLAALYGKKYKKVPLHDFTPYRLLLIGCIMTLFLVGTLLFMVSAYSQAGELVVVGILGILISLGMIVVPYAFSHEIHSMARLTYACIAGSIGIWSLAAMTSLPFYAFRLEALQVMVPAVVSLAAWFVYIYLLHRHRA